MNNLYNIKSNLIYRMKMINLDWNSAVEFIKKVAVVFLTFKAVQLWGMPFYIFETDGYSTQSGYELQGLANLLLFLPLMMIAVYFSGKRKLMLFISLIFFAIVNYHIQMGFQYNSMINEVPRLGIHLIHLQLVSFVYLAFSFYEVGTQKPLTAST